MAFELTVAKRWLVAQLRANAAITADVGAGVNARIFDTEAPEGTAFRYITFQVQSPGQDLVTLNHTRIASTPLFLVKAWDQTDDITALSSLAAAIDAALHRTFGATTDGNVYASHREEPFESRERIVGGLTVWSLGGLYRLMAQG